MRDLILEVKAEAERELLLAQAKVEVANSILARFEQYEISQASEVCEATVGAYEEVSVEAEIIDGNSIAV